MNGEAVPCEEILIRLVGRKGDILPSGEAAPEAFILRKNDSGKLSLFRKTISDIQVCKAALKKPYGAATLHAGTVRSTVCSNGRVLDVLDAEGEGTNIPGHASLVGLPDPITEYEDAEHVASLLSRQSRGIPIT